MKKRIAGLFMMLAMVGVMVAGPGSAGAQEPSSVAVKAFICPGEYAGSNYEDDCDPLADVEASVYIDASEYGFTEATDANGNAYFEVNGGGPFVVELGVPGDFADFVSYCGQVGVPEPMQVENPNSNRMIVSLGSGLDVECTFFVIPVDQRGEVSVPEKPADIDTLPSTGVGIMDDHSGLATVAMLLGAAILLAGLGLLTTREDLFEQR